MISSPRSLGGTGIPPGQAEAPGNPRASLGGVEDSSKEMGIVRRSVVSPAEDEQVGVNLDKLTQEVLSLRKKLKDREQTANECITKAKGRLRQTNKRAEAAFSELINRECAEEERFAFVKYLTEDLHDIRARYRKGEPLHMISWDHSKQAIDSKMNRLTSRIEAVGLSPSAIMDELELQEQSTDREERVNFLELGRRQKELAATERRDGFAELGGSATTTNTDTCITTAITTSTSSPAVSALLEEKRYIRERMKECHKLALDVLRFYDRRQTAADDNISRLQQAFVMCNARRDIIRAARNEAKQELAKISVKVEKEQLAQVANHTPPANSILEEIAKSELGYFRNAFVELVSRSDCKNRIKNLFLAKQVLSAEKRWYTQGKMLGEGGFGCVYEVSVPTLGGKKFALKTLRMDEDDDPADSFGLKIQSDGLKAEMSVHNRVPPHMNIAQAKAMDDRSSSNLMLLLEMGNGDLDHLALDGEDGSLGEAFGVVAGAIAGVDHLHQHGIGHNDLKPANILLFPDNSGTCRTTGKLIDFGLALAFGDLCKGHGTLGSMPPEALLEKHLPCRPEQDVFAMALIVLQIASKPPYKSRNMFFNKAVEPEGWYEEWKDLEPVYQRKYLEKWTLRNMCTSAQRRKLFDPAHLCDELGYMKNEVLAVVDLATSPDPKLRPPMKTLGELATRVSKQLLGNEPLSVGAASPAIEHKADAPQQSEPLLRSQVGSRGAFSAGPPLVAVSGEGIGGDSDGGGWATGGEGNGSVELRHGRGGVGGGGDGVGGGGGGGGGDGNTTFSSDSKDTSATTAVTDTTACVSVEEGVSTGDVGCQGSMPDMVDIKWGSPSSVQNAISAPGETDGALASRAGEVREGGRGGNGRIGQVDAGAPAQASQGMTPASHRAGANVPVPVDGRGTVRQGSRRKTWRPPQRASANIRNRRKGAQWQRQAVPTGGPVALPQGIGGTAGDVGGVCHVAPTRENWREVPPAPQPQQAAYGMGSTQPWGYPQTFQQPDCWEVPPHIPYEAGVAMGGAIYWPAPAVGCDQSHAPSVYAPRNAGTQSPCLPPQALPDVTVCYPQSSLAATGEGWEYGLQPRCGLPEPAAVPETSERQTLRYCYTPPPHAVAVHQRYYAATAMGPGHSGPLSAVGTVGPVGAACVGHTNMDCPTPSGPGQGYDPVRERAGEPPCRERFVQEQRVVFPPLPDVHGGFGGVAASPFPPEDRAPPPPRVALDWASGGILSRCGSVAPTSVGVRWELYGGYRPPAGMASAVPGINSYTRQQGGSWQAGAVPQGPPYGGPAPSPRAHAPCDGYGGWAATPQQPRFVACRPPWYYHPGAFVPPKQNVYWY
eukprot:jgi/Undpi1/4140/HiC_scaffold_16.g07507.m1